MIYYLEIYMFLTILYSSLLHTVPGGSNILRKVPY
jgi:hypothetical protein